MRIRYLKNTESILGESELIIRDPAAQKGMWRALGPGAYPGRLCLEIGCGKGRFIRDMSRKYPQDLWIGAEKISTILARAVKQLDPGIDHNVFLIRQEAEKLGDCFEEGEIDRIYLNFSDPWPKEKHAKRRLTSERFLPLYRRLLSAKGEIRLKTDNDALFAYSLLSLAQGGFRVEEQTDDLHHSPWAKENVMTEYEENFTRMGKAIHYLRAVPI